MRNIAVVPSSTESVRRVMTYATDAGAYLFLYTSLEDGPCASDEWYESLRLAEITAAQRFGLKPQDWTVIADPPAGAQHDWIHPTRVKCDDAGNKLWGQFEPMSPATG